MHIYPQPIHTPQLKLTHLDARPSIYLFNPQKHTTPHRELNISGVYRVPAAALAKQTTESAQGSPDVQLVYGGAFSFACVVEGLFACLFVYLCGRV